MSATLPPIRQAAAALCYGLRGDQCDQCVAVVHCTRHPAWLADARLAVAAYLRATDRADEAQQVEAIPPQPVPANDAPALSDEDAADLDDAIWGMDDDM